MVFIGHSTICPYGLPDYSIKRINPNASALCITRYSSEKILQPDKIMGANANKVNSGFVKCWQWIQPSMRFGCFFYHKDTVFKIKFCGGHPVGCPYKFVNSRIILFLGRCRFGAHIFDLLFFFLKIGNNRLNITDDWYTVTDNAHHRNQNAHNH